MARINLDLYEESVDEVYSDGDIENDLLEYAQNQEEDWHGDRRWPITYHMSHLRENILNWYPFKKGCSILEIGAGCGALTGMLCERGEQVVAIELTKRRAKVNYYRHQKHENLEIIVCDFQKIPKHLKFDYIIINGVLEYAAYMIQSENPYRDFLNRAAQHLNQNGVMLLSIENRIGLKYLSGAKEDHTGLFFSGINDYSNGERIRTFTHKELQTLIKSADLRYKKFYYPYPDYKFPMEIFTDHTINNMEPSSHDYPLDMQRASLFNEKSLYRSLMQNGSMQIFSNSFLVEITNSDMVTNEIAYVKLSSNRNEQFRIGTYFNNDKREAYKIPLHMKARQHLERMLVYSGFKYQDRLKNITASQKEQFNRREIAFPFVITRSLESYWKSYKDTNQIEKLIEQMLFFQKLLYDGVKPSSQPISPSFEDLFGKKKCEQKLKWSIKSTNIDMIAGNVFESDFGYEVIDFEWHLSCEIPQEFILWRMIKQFIVDQKLTERISNDTLRNIVEIDEKTEECFMAWEANFVQEFVGMKDLGALANDVIPLDLNQIIVRETNDKKVISTLFYDIGMGFSEKLLDHAQANHKDGDFEVAFEGDHLKHANALRWDPIEGFASEIIIQQIQTDAKNIRLTAINAEQTTEAKDNEYRFYTFDPQFRVEGDFSNATYIKIRFSCKIMNWTEGYYRREQEILTLDQELNEAHATRISMEATLLKLNGQLNEAHEELKVKNQNLERLTTEHNRIKDKLRNSRLKTALKILLYGDVVRRKSDE